MRDLWGYHRADYGGNGVVVQLYTTEHIWGVSWNRICEGETGNGSLPLENLWLRIYRYPGMPNNSELTDILSQLPWDIA